MLERNNVEEEIRIQMFGGFLVTQGTRSVGDLSNRTRQLWSLLEYLVVNRHRFVGQEELAQVLWPQQKSGNPANALKNLVYRLRSIFNEYGFDFFRKMLLFEEGSYRWNNALMCEVDIEVFGQRCKAAGDPGCDPEKALQYCQEAIALYKGDFLAGSGTGEWATRLEEQYREMFYECAFTAVDLLAERKRFREAQEICEQAVVVGPFEENAHCRLIRMLLRQGKQEEALSCYNRLNDRFYRELGQRPSEETRSLYREIARSIHAVEIDLETVEQDLRENGRALGAFYCDYAVFREFYRFQARAVMRTDLPIFFGLLTLTDEIGKAVALRQLCSAMDLLYGIIRDNLRKGDVFCRYSPAQYLLMIAANNRENAATVLDRIQRRFLRDTHNKKTQLHLALRQLESAVESEELAEVGL